MDWREAGRGERLVHVSSTNLGFDLLFLAAEAIECALQPFQLVTQCGSVVAIDVQSSAQLAKLCFERSRSLEGERRRQDKKRMQLSVWPC